jgi:hypothetical protein
MTRLTEQQVLQLAKTQDVWKVSFRESERGWGSETWDEFYDSFGEAQRRFEETNKDSPTEYVPDYYIVAYAPEKFSVTLA